jgi:hypothetical protein
MFTAYVHNKLHMPSNDSSLVMEFIPKTEENFRTAAMLCYTVHNDTLRDGSVAPTSQTRAPAILLLLSEEEKAPDWPTMP